MAGDDGTLTGTGRSLPRVEGLDLLADFAQLDQAETRPGAKRIDGVFRGHHDRHEQDPRDENRRAREPRPRAPGPLADGV